MPPGNEAHEAPSNGASATAYEKLQRGHTSQVRTYAQRKGKILIKHKYKYNYKDKDKRQCHCLREAAERTHLASRNTCTDTNMNTKVNTNTKTKKNDKDTKTLQREHTSQVIATERNEKSLSDGIC